MTVLCFEFVYNSYNEVLERLLLRCAHGYQIQHRLVRKGDRVQLFTEAIPEVQASFAEVLGEQLPLSLFLDSWSIHEMEAFPAERLQWKSESPPAINLPFCPQCQKAVNDPQSSLFGNPFCHCEICGYHKRTYEQPTVLEYFSSADAAPLRAAKGHDVFALFERYVESLIMHGSGVLQTFSGSYEVFINGKVDDRDRGEAFFLLSDPVYIENIVFPHQGAFQAMASLEKPLVSMRMQSEYCRENGLYHRMLLCGMADDVVSMLLCQSLSRRQLVGIYMFPIQSLDMSNLSGPRLKMDGKFGPTEQRLIVNTAAGRTFLVAGERSLFPAFLPSQSPERMHANHSRYAAQVRDSRFCTVDYDTQRAEVIDLQETALAALQSVIKEQGISPDALLGLDMSQENVSLISLKSGICEHLWEMKPGFDSLGDIVSKITESDTGAVLSANFRQIFPDCWRALESMISADAKVSTFQELWAVCCVLIEAESRLTDVASTFAHTKAPRIAFSQNSLESKLQYDNSWPIRSIMSYRLAGVSAEMIAAGIEESFAEFIVRAVLQYSQLEEINTLVCTGDMLDNHRMAAAFLQGVGSTLDVHSNKTLLTSGANVAYGKLFVQ